MAQVVLEEFVVVLRQAWSRRNRVGGSGGTPGSDGRDPNLSMPDEGSVVFH